MSNTIFKGGEIFLARLRPPAPPLRPPAPSLVTGLVPGYGTGHMSEIAYKLSLISSF